MKFILVARHLQVSNRESAFKAMEAGPPLAMTDIASKPLTGAVFRKGMVLNE
jgi:hypothetical protein